MHRWEHRGQRETRYYEARNDYTNNSKTMFCVTDVRAIGKFIPREFLRVIGALRKCLMGRHPNYTKKLLPERPV